MIHDGVHVCAHHSAARAQRAAKRLSRSRAGAAAAVSRAAAKVLHRGRNKTPRNKFRAFKLCSWCREENSRKRGALGPSRWTAAARSACLSKPKVTTVALSIAAASVLALSRASPPGARALSRSTSPCPRRGRPKSSEVFHDFSYRANVLVFFHRPRSCTSSSPRRCSAASRLAPP